MYITLARPIQLNTDIQSQSPEERPTFDSLQWRLEDFFTNTEASYTEANNVLN